MKIMHLSDLHIGKKVNGFSMLEDQAHILREILLIIDAEGVDTVLIAGDVYDKSLPPTEAVHIFDDFLTEIARRGLTVFVISGNHDSPERLAFGARLLKASGVYLSPVFNGSVTPVTLKDAYGEIDVYMLPFLKPAYVRCREKAIEIESYRDAVAYVLERLSLDGNKRNILMAHQFVSGAGRCESEEISVGGLDQIDPDLFAAFDYVALGHLHNPQRIGRDTLRYSGSPLKYSFSEARHQKSVPIVTLAEKGAVKIELVPLTPLRELREIKGSYLAVTARDFYRDHAVDDYLHITLTDEEDVPDAMAKLRAIYPNLMKLDYENTRTRAGGAIDSDEEMFRKSPLELVADFYERQNNQPLRQEQRDYAVRLAEKIWEEES